jgi:23S rRNA (adenine2503-C2)-methyltransferase
MNFNRFADWLAERKQPAFRLKQVKEAYFHTLASSWDEVTTFPKNLRDEAAKEFPWNELTIVQVQESPQGDTVKTLFACQDGKKIETVLMRHEDERDTVCISSQVGCAMACTFCATGTMGLKRNLTAEEIVEQVVQVQRWLKKHDSRVSNVVFMGMGEPMHNYDEVMRSIKVMNSEEGLHIGARRISISTCGVVPGILRLADEPYQVNLAISLHSATDEIRSRIMPVNKAYPLAKLRAALEVYMEKTNRKIMFEYLLLKGINDREVDAIALAKWLGEDCRLFHVNLIKYHETEAFQGTARGERNLFIRYLHDLHIPAPIALPSEKISKPPVASLPSKKQKTEISHRVSLLCVLEKLLKKQKPKGFAQVHSTEAARDV